MRLPGNREPLTKLRNGENVADEISGTQSIVQSPMSKRMMGNNSANRNAQFGRQTMVFG